MTLRPAASPDALDAAQTSVRHPLPRDYLAFMRQHNGGEGWIGDFYLSLDAIEELPEFQHPWGDESEPYVVFGSDGAGELFAFDARDRMAVFMIPAIGGPQHAIRCAETLTEMFERLDRGDDLFAR